MTVVVAGDAHAINLVLACQISGCCFTLFRVTYVVRDYHTYVSTDERSSHVHDIVITFRVATNVLSTKEKGGHAVHASDPTLDLYEFEQASHVLSRDVTMPV